MAPEVERAAPLQAEPYGLSADVFSFGVLAYELYHLHETGEDYYGEGGLFDGGGLLEGLECVRGPLTSTPQQMPPRPATCDVDEVWALLTECMAAEPSARPTFAHVASTLSVVLQAEGGGRLDGWL